MQAGQNITQTWIGLEPARARSRQAAARTSAPGVAQMRVRALAVAVDANVHIGVRMRVWTEEVAPRSQSQFEGNNARELCEVISCSREGEAPTLRYVKSSLIG